MDKLFSTLGIGDWAGPLRGPLRAAVIIFVAWVVLRLVKSVFLRWLDKTIAQGTDAERTQRFSTLSRVIGYVITLVFSITTLMLALAELGVSIAPLLASAGIAGVAIGFGAQSLVKDYFTGLVLLLENQVRVGDFVELEGKGGTVEEVTLRYIRLRDREGSVHFVPNGEIKVVTTKTREFAYAFMLLEVDNECAIDDVTRALHEAGAELRTDEALAPFMLGDLEIDGVEELTASAVVLRARIKTVPGKQWQVKRELLRRVYLAFQKHRIEFPVTRTTLSGSLQRAVPN